MCVFFYVFALCCLYCAIIFMYLFSAYAHHYVFFYVCACVYDLYIMCVCACLVFFCCFFFYVIN